MTHQTTASELARAPHRRLVDETEAAILLGLSKRTLQAWRVRGGGPPYLKLGRLVRYDTSMLWEWAGARVSHNTSEMEG